MPREKQRYSAILNAAVFAILEIAAIIMVSGPASLQGIWLDRFSHRVRAALWGGGENVRNYFLLSEQNKALARENAELADLVRSYSQKRLSYEKGSIYDTLNGHFRMIPATIVKVSRNTQRNYIILDKGSDDGVKPQTGIITTNGVVGVVGSVGKRFAYGITLMNPRMSVSARIGKTGLTAPLEWDGVRTDGAIMRNLPLHYDISPGDTVWTSGFSSVFPPDIPIGVTGRVRRIDGSVNQVSVSLFQDFALLRYVIITENLDREEISALEKEAAK
jgi:rod shape-determining protein MreC